MSNRAAQAVKKIPAAANGKRKAGGKARPADANDEIGLDALLAMRLRRAAIPDLDFQDFIRTLAAVDIKPTQYSVLTVIGANPGLSQMAVAQRLGIERARLVHLLDSLENRKLLKQVAPGPTAARTPCT